MKSYPLCLPVQARTRAEVLKIIDTHPHYPFIEVWLGAIEDLDDGFLSHLATIVGPRLIALFRTRNLEITLPLEQRLYFLEELSGRESFIDLDIHAQREEIEYAKRKALSLKKIVSYHNYHETPSESFLANLVEEMLRLNPAVTKLSTYCNSPGDAVRLLALGIKLREKGHRTVALGMGAHGLATRIFGTLWGNAFAFAPQRAEGASAPGQLTESELLQLLERLGG